MQQRCCSRAYIQNLGDVRLPKFERCLDVASDGSLRRNLDARTSIDDDLVELTILGSVHRTVAFGKPADQRCAGEFIRDNSINLNIHAPESSNSERLLRSWLGRRLLRPGCMQGLICRCCLRRRRCLDNGLPKAFGGMTFEALVAVASLLSM